MNETANIFKPTPTEIVLGEEKYTLVYDLNAFCEMEKSYESVDSVLQMLLGNAAAVNTAKITYCDAPCLAEDIKIDGNPLTAYLDKIANVKQAKNADTLNLLWLGCLHDHTEYDADGNVVKYTISKSHLGTLITFRNLRDVNAKIMTALLRDLVPAVDEAQGKNVEQVKEPILKVQGTQA